MGTSNSFGGQNSQTPLIPDWLDSQNEENGEVPADRFRKPRLNMTNFAKGNGLNERYLKNALSSYVTDTFGGSRNASQRMNVQKSAVILLAGFLGSLRDNDITDTFEEYGLTSLRDQPTETIFLSLMEIICPPGGTIDEGITRRAYVKTIENIVEKGDINLEDRNLEDTKFIMASFVSNTIMARVYNDIATRVIVISGDNEKVQYVEDQINSFIKACTNPAVSHLVNEKIDFKESALNDLIENIYFDTFEMLRMLNEEEET